MEARARICPWCSCPLTLSIAPRAADHYVRVPLRDGRWQVTEEPPAASEQRSEVAYACAGCHHTFRLVETAVYTV